MANTVLEGEHLYTVQVRTGLIAKLLEAACRHEWDTTVSLKIGRDFLRNPALPSPRTPPAPEVVLDRQNGGKAKPALRNSYSRGSPLPSGRYCSCITDDKNVAVAASEGCAACPAVELKKALFLHHTYYLCGPNSCHCDPHTSLRGLLFESLPGYAHTHCCHRTLYYIQVTVNRRVPFLISERKIH